MVDAVIFSPALAAAVIGFIFILVATISKDEKWQMAYGIMGLIALFWSFGFFGVGRLTQSLIPPLTLLFGLFSFYTKGSAQLLSVVVTIVLLVSL